ncbi:hypothetical protein EXE25_12590 [Acinetobacter bouvetii]|uniref:DUF3800 domain-containing protein n=1 Tax=Acinetobacter bouvetii TaxID=202951 RepID=A0A4Q7ARZ8_9GAMM|nr:DUF3800 domain-containing protein [Acinetobacter bouvetii]RZG65678.1 hypothetical protein EXE25_12590 [Acinetobacter bouvetii]
MSYKYYVDESGTSGDSLKDNFDSLFNDQLYYTSVAIGIKKDIESNVEDEFYNLLSPYFNAKGEVKSSLVFDSNVNLILKCIDLIDKYELPCFSEVVDKKYHINNTVVNHYIFPPYYLPSHLRFSDDTLHCCQIIAQLLTDNMPTSYYNELIIYLQAGTEEELLIWFNKLINNIEAHIGYERDKNRIIDSIKESLDDYQIMKKYEGIDVAIRRFTPIPDKLISGKEHRLLPQVPTLASLLARINKFQNKVEIELIHDEQTEYSRTFLDLKESLESKKDTELEINEANYDFDNPIILKHIKSQDSVFIQVSDIVSGFLMRYFRDIKNKGFENIDQIYHEIYHRLSLINSSKGINLVLSPRERENFDKAVLLNYILDYS